MVQELQVLKCFSCETFQSHIVKKKNQWLCKVCGMKQSIKKVYGQGSGKDCRIHTQKLNALRAQKEDDKEPTVIGEENHSLKLFYDQEGASFSTNGMVLKASKWSKYKDANKFEIDECGFSPEERLNQNKTKTTNLISKFKRKRSMDKTVEEANSPIDCHEQLEQTCPQTLQESHGNFKKPKHDYSYTEKEITLENNGHENCNFDIENNSVENIKPNKQTVKAKASLKWAKYMEEDTEDEEQVSDNHTKVELQSQSINNVKEMSYDSAKNAYSLLKWNETTLNLNAEKIKQCSTNKGGNVPFQTEVFKNNDEQLISSNKLPLFEQHSEFLDNDFQLDF